MLCRCLFHTRRVSIHTVKKMRLAFMFVLVNILCLSIAPAGRGFIAIDHLGYEFRNFMIKKVHKDYWIIHYSYVDDFLGREIKIRFNDKELTAAISKALRTWLQPLRDYTQKPIVDEFRYRLSDDWKDADLGIVFYVPHRNYARLSTREDETPFIRLGVNGGRITRKFMATLVHEVGHVFGLADTYLRSKPKWVWLDDGGYTDTGGLDDTRGAQPTSVMSLSIPPFGLLGYRYQRYVNEYADLQGLAQLGADDVNGIIWLYKYTYEGLPLEDCFFPDYKLEDFSMGCRPKSPLIFELKHGLNYSVFGSLPVLCNMSRRYLYRRRGPDLERPPTRKRNASEYMSKTLYALRIIKEDERLDVNAQDRDGMTALHYAVMYGSTEVVKQLLTHKDINPFVRDKQGRSALELAQEHKLDHMVALLTHPLTLSDTAKRELTIAWEHLKQQY